MINIREMTVADYDAVYRLWRETEGVGLRTLDDSREGIEQFLRRNPSTCFLAMDDKNEKILGVLLCGHDGRRGYIYHFLVIPACRRQGLGRALLEEALRALKKQGIRKSALVVFADNAVGNAFWEKMGFISRPDLIYRNKSLDERNF
ncbi:MAG: GNAT family N-acetyltransferase [Synergistaceae bacterium]|jgi:ribosomal protein S18 acetylase RimI-like enzyme|nr:GNAT family N-acetyltransferase [Synergistaceae bacterium]